MTINVEDAEILLSFAEEMANYGYHYAVCPLSVITDSDTIQFFKTSWEAKEFIYEIMTDTDIYEAKSTKSLISDLNVILQSGIDTSRIEAVDVNDFMRLYKEKK